MEKQTGCVHIYCGDGKGKTTCGMGLCTRAAGYGYRVLIYQFMKDNSTSERKVLLLSPNVTFVPGQDKIKFSFLMTPEEKAEQKRYYEEQFQKVTEKQFRKNTMYCFWTSWFIRLEANCLMSSSFWIFWITSRRSWK